MMQQKLGQGDEVPIKEEFKIRALTESEAKLDREPLKEELREQPIFRIDENLSNMGYQLNDPAYRVDSKLLHNSKIRPQDREKLKSWMLSETQKLYERETYCHASKFLDMFFAKGHRVQRNAFQALGIACLILAAKVNERRVPSISFQVFDRDQIFNFEKHLLRVFNFRVNPVTYISLSQLLFYFWDRFECEKHPFKTVKYHQEGLQSIKRVRTVLETLDCMDLVCETLDIPVNVLVFAVFWVENRRFCLRGSSYKKMSQTDSEFQFSQVYNNFMTEFERSLKKQVPAFSQIKLTQKIILYTLNFSRINPKIEANKKYKHFMFELSRQTYSPEITEIAQAFLHRRSLQVQGSR